MARAVVRQVEAAQGMAKLVQQLLRNVKKLGEGGLPETRKPVLGGLLEVFRRLSETGLNSLFGGPG